MSLLPNTSSDFLKGLAASDEQVQYLKMLNALYLGKIEELNKEIERLKSGNFTDKEFQDLCHTQQVQDGYTSFVNGCNEYQNKLFGKSANDIMVNREDAAKRAFDTVMACLKSEYKYSNLQLASSVAYNIRKM